MMKKAAISRLFGRRAVDENAVRQSPAFREASSEAEGLANDPERLRQLFDDATKKTETTLKGPFAETWAQLLAMIRLIRSYSLGNYREIPWKALTVIIMAIVYFVTPIDFIPDWLPLAGVIDDASVIAFALKTVKSDLERFMQWESASSS